ncbi:hypothetical protein MKY98_26730 [Paenibacillus sp. FSL M8-0228]|nr:hypothetical protein [Paenibacillus polymyxa]
MSIDWSKIPAEQYPFLKDKIPTRRRWGKEGFSLIERRNSTP